LAKHKRICILSTEEGEALRRGGHDALDCRNHQHCSPDEADALLTDSEHRPWLNDFTSKPMAVHALLPSGAVSKRHIIQIIEFIWRVVGQTKPGAAPGRPGYQLLPTKKYA